MLLTTGLLVSSFFGAKFASDDYIEKIDRIPFRIFHEIKEAGRLRGTIVVTQESVEGQYVLEDGKTVRPFLTYITDQTLVRDLKSRKIDVKEVIELVTPSQFWNVFPFSLSLIVLAGTYYFHRIRDRVSLERLRSLYNTFEEELRARLHMEDKRQTKILQVLDAAQKRWKYFAEHRAVFESFIHLRNSNEHFGRKLNMFAAPPSIEYLDEIETHIRHLFNLSLKDAVPMQMGREIAHKLHAFGARNLVAQKGHDILWTRKDDGELAIFTARGFLLWDEATFHGQPIDLRKVSVGDIVKTWVNEPGILFVPASFTHSEALERLAHTSPTEPRVVVFAITSDGTSGGELIGMINPESILG